MAKFKMVQNDTAPNRRKALFLDGTAMDITGATVKYKIKNTATGARTNDAHNIMDVITSSPAVVEYDWQAGDLPTEGGYVADIEVTFANGKIETIPDQDQISVRPEA